MGSVYFLEAVIDGQSGHAWLRFPADTAPPEVYTILRHAARKGAGQGPASKPCSQKNAGRHSKEPQFRTLCVWSAPETETPFEFDVEGQKQYELLFDPASDVLCLAFRLVTETHSASEFQSSDTASVATTKTGRWIDTEVELRTERSGEDLRHIAIRWDPAVFSSYECTQCLHPYNSNPTTDGQIEDDDDYKIPSICWRDGHDPSPTHDFKPVVPRDVLEYWPDQFPQLEQVSMIVEGITSSELGHWMAGAKVIHGPLERFLVVKQSTMDKRWSIPAAFAKEMEKNFAEIGRQHGVKKPPPRCSVLVRVGYDA
ncbi:hypothetical protein QBC34DRAFT_386515 [Podospora aff. communis PSN243]|uniref:Uncharacterized protein n=1 Tax=Podospora aff. communis PSN243 TaxID=3040156 RepID=A0AAV9G757_9PEZI|nr:hypothetical protein QBC34DRAFT_386515 [Podospora aff. communis PSN243]